MGCYFDRGAKVIVRVFMVGERALLYIGLQRLGLYPKVSAELTATQYGPRLLTCAPFDALPPQLPMDRLNKRSNTVYIYKILRGMLTEVDHKLVACHCVQPPLNAMD